MTQEEDLAQLKKQLSEVLVRLNEAEEREKRLLEQVSELQADKQGLSEQLAIAQQRIKDLEQQKRPPPAFVTANVKKPPEGQRKPRKKRDPKHNHARRRETPTR